MVMVFICMKNLQFTACHLGKDPRPVRVTYVGVNAQSLGLVLMNERGAADDGLFFTSRTRMCVLPFIICYKVIPEPSLQLIACSLGQDPIPVPVTCVSVNSQSLVIVVIRERGAANDVIFSPLERGCVFFHSSDFE